MWAVLRRGALPTGALALVLGIGTPAMADSYRHHDQRHDVGRTRDAGGYRHAPANRTFDITDLQVDHGKQRIQFQVSLRSTALHGTEQRRLAFTMQTDADAYSGFWISTKDGLVDAEVRDDTTHQLLGCAQSGRSKGHALWWTIPRACFQDPHWIKVAFTVTGRSHGMVFRDNALSASWRHPLKSVYSSRVRASA